MAKCKIDEPMSSNEIGKDYIVQVRVKNGPLLRAIRRSFRSVAEFCRSAEIPVMSVYNYLSLQRAPIGKNGDWNPTVLKMANALGLPPFCLFPEQHLEVALQRNSGELEFSQEELTEFILANSEAPADPEQEMIRQQARQKLLSFVDALPPQQSKVIKYRFGLDQEEPHTLEETGARLSVSRERIRQIECTALRSLRKKNKIRQLAEAGCSIAAKHT